VDHELTHCDVDEEGKLSLRPHDLEEFNVIVRRYGLWRAEVQLFLEAARHPDLFSSEEDNRDYERGTVNFENNMLMKEAKA
jgi:hypothetical protein